MRTPRWSTMVMNAIAASALLLSGAAAQVEPPPERAVAVENEFIRIRVNTGPQEAGRFAVDTTGGDPSRSADDGKVLIYGSREPWTSYTTIVIDGTPHVFGGSTERRAGRGPAATGLSAAPRAADDQVIAIARVGEIEIRQRLGFARSPTTRVKDAALIAYEVTNHGPREHVVGLRAMVDTMLGSNDGAPLRAGGSAIERATQLAGADLPEYWQAFDSLADPAVISQGTLRAAGLTPPDRLEMVDWGTLADNAWSFAFPAGADFTRRGEEAQDTAVALYWDPAPLGPGESRTYATLYGVGGVSLSPAQLSLGLTAPAEVDFQYDEARPFSVVAYVENSGGFESRGTRLTLTLSEGLKLAEGAAAVRLGLVGPGQTRQAVWRVVPTGQASGMLQIVATVTSENLEPNRVTRDITVNSPPQLAVKLAAPESLRVTLENRYRPNPFEVEARIANRGAQAGRNLVASIELPEGLVSADGGEATQVFARLDPAAELVCRWNVRALGIPTGPLPISVRATAAGAKPASDRVRIHVPELVPELRVHPAVQTVPELTDGEPTLVPISVRLVPARDFRGATVTVNYDGSVLEPLYVSRGEGFVEEGRLLSPWSAGRRYDGQLADVGGERSGAPALRVAEATLFTVVFMVKQPGEAAITLEPTSVLAAGGEGGYRVVDGAIVVEASE
ncbi:MAG TPA: cohesin domain-containing protein [Armatimonadota bacterium]|nr:cohesin domain-containing protein [Armatimonadota bacterium]